jgi:hypothetical protein
LAASARDVTSARRHMRASLGTDAGGQERPAATEHAEQ